MKKVIDYFEEYLDKCGLLLEPETLQYVEFKKVFYSAFTSGMRHCNDIYGIENEDAHTKAVIVTKAELDGFWVAEKVRYDSGAYSKLQNRKPNV